MFSAYVFQIGKRCWLNQRRRFGKESLAASEAGLDAVAASPASEPEAIALERLRHARIRRAIAALPEPYRTVFHLCQEEGMRYREAAVELDIPIGTVKSRMAEAFVRLRRALSPEEEL
jgi:RNA polymerase sigma-70 factor (ECF subfamily)